MKNRLKKYFDKKDRDNAFKDLMQLFKKRESVIDNYLKVMGTLIDGEEWKSE